MAVANPERHPVSHMNGLINAVKKPKKACFNTRSEFFRSLGAIRPRIREIRVKVFIGLRFARQPVESQPQR